MEETKMEFQTVIDCLFKEHTNPQSQAIVITSVKKTLVQCSQTMVNIQGHIKNATAVENRNVQVRKVATLK